MDELIYFLVAVIFLKEIVDIIKKISRKNKYKRSSPAKVVKLKPERKTKYTAPRYEKTTQEIREPASEDRSYLDAYKPKYVMTANEKNAFFKIKAAADELGYTALSKVRLFDLVEPKQFGDKGAQWKIQAKHVDFVILDKTLTARYVIELTDSSHDAEDRAERDKFVATVLRNCGYRVLFTRNIEKDRLISWIREQEGHYISNKNTV